LVDVKDRVEIANARSDVMAAGSVAIAGIIALCNELAHAGELDETRLGRIHEFMLVTLKRSFGTMALKSHLENELTKHFADLADRMS
jgi:hypothetical protein